MSAEGAGPQVVLRSELRWVHYDPPVANHIRAYVPEAHASSSCPFSLKGGHKEKLPTDRAGIAWCPSCTTDDPAEATLRNVNGRWVPQLDEIEPKSNGRS